MEQLLRPARLTLDASSDTAAQEWAHWKLTLTNYIGLLQNPSDADKLAALVVSVTPNIYNLIEKATTYDAAIAILEANFVKPTNELFSRHKLLARRQHEGESISEYMGALSVLAKDCNYAAVTADVHRDESIKVAFVKGIRNPIITQRLLEEGGTRTELFNKARTLEAAIRNNETLSVNQRMFLNEVDVRPENPQPANKPEEDQTLAAASRDFSPRNSRNPRNSCYYCGYSNHSRRLCPARDMTCNLCSKTGHFARVCQSTRRTNPPSRNFQRNSAPNPQSTAAATAPPELADAVIRSQVNNHPVSALVDSGSSDSFIDHKLCLDLGLPISQTDNQSIRMASQTCRTTSLGSVYVTLQLAEFTYNQVRLQILPDLCSDIILGHDILKRHEKLEIPFCGPLSPLVLPVKPGLVCALKVAHITPPPLFSDLPPNVRPIVCKSRKFSEEDRKFIHSDRGQQFLSNHVKSFLMSHGIGSSHTSSYNPAGNGQCERFNGTIWRTIKLALRAKGLHASQWEVVLPESLHAICSLLCTATNETPHNRLFRFQRKNTPIYSLPPWLLEQGSALLRKHVKSSKYEDPCEAVQIMHTNPYYARVQTSSGLEKSVPLRDLAPLPQDTACYTPDPSTVHNTDPCITPTQEQQADTPCISVAPIDDEPVSPATPSQSPTINPPLRRSSRNTTPAERFDPLTYHLRGCSSAGPGD